MPTEATELATGSAQLTPPRKLRPYLPLELQRVVFRAMAMNPADRYQSAAEMRQALLTPTGSAVGVPLGAKFLLLITIGGTVGVLTSIALVWVVISPHNTPTLTSVVHTPIATPTLPLDSTGSPVTILVSPTPTHTMNASVPSEQTPPTKTATPTATQSPTSIPTLTPTSVSSEMVRVPAGNFMQGSTVEQVDDAYRFCIDVDDSDQCWRSALDDELPQHPVYLNEFYIDKHEVTNAQYAECVKAGVCDPPSSFSSNTRNSYFDDPTHADYPIIYLTWYDADRYCQWVGKRLPTEAEWEKAARGENEIVWPWGNSFSLDKGNIRPGEVKPDTSDTTRIGSYPEGASPYGTMDMVGNVWEWVADWYGESYYATVTSQNPQGPSSGEKKVIRGGSWNSNVGSARAASRAGASPDQRYFDIGFRCAQ